MCFCIEQKTRCAVLKHNSVSAQNVLLYFLLGFMFQAFFFTWHLYFNYSCCLVPLCLPFVVWAVPFFPSEIPLLPHWLFLWCGTCSAGDCDWWPRQACLSELFSGTNGKAEGSTRAHNNSFSLYCIACHHILTNFLLFRGAVTGHLSPVVWWCSREGFDLFGMLEGSPPIAFLFLKSVFCVASPFPSQWKVRVRILCC